MPRVYLTPTELQETPLGIGLSASLSQLGIGVQDKLLARASQRCDTFCQKRLQAPGTTTLTATATAGTTTISVTSTLTLDQLAEQAVILDQGAGNQETVLISPGGITVTSWLAPYPGTITLAAPLMFTHNNGASVNYVYKEVTQAGRASNADPFSEALQSQAAQLALAHLPPVHAGLTRIVFLKSYPIISVFTIEHSYSFDNTYNAIDTSGISIEPTEGWLRFRIGQVIIPEGLIRTTYEGGYTVIPDDIKHATSLYLAEEMKQLSNPFGATDLQLGKKRQAFAFKDGKSPLVQEAEAMLMKYRRLI